MQFNVYVSYRIEEDRTPVCFTHAVKAIVEGKKVEQTVDDNAPWYCGMCEEEKETKTKLKETKRG